VVGFYGEPAHSPASQHGSSLATSLHPVWHNLSLKFILKVVKRCVLYVVAALTRALNFEAFRGKGGHCDCKLQNDRRSNKGSIVFLSRQRNIQL